MEGPWPFYWRINDAEAWPNGRPGAGGQEALAEGGAAWPSPVPGSFRPSLLQAHRSLFNRLFLPFRSAAGH